MKLQDWLKTHDKSIAWLAAETGLSVSYIWRLMPHDEKAPERSPSLNAAALIARATANAVTANDFMGEAPHPPRPKPAAVAA